MNFAHNHLPPLTIELSDDSRSPSPNPTIVLSSDDEENETCNMEEVGKVYKCLAPFFMIASFLLYLIKILFIIHIKHLHSHLCFWGYFVLFLRRMINLNNKGSPP